MFGLIERVPGIEGGEGVGVGGGFGVIGGGEVESGVGGGVVVGRREIGR
ncbi:hypothetical protein [Bacillus altitudinis]|nr:hypothetical protein [Bacillus altitudinis]